MAQQTYLYVFGRNKNVNLKYFLNIFHKGERNTWKILSDP